MKPVYVFMAVAVTGTGAFLSANYLHLHDKFSQGLITNSLYVLTGITVFVATLIIVAGIRRKRFDKGFMTIKQYYQYKTFAK